MESKIIQQSVKVPSSLMTGPEEVEWVLTPHEEAQVIRNVVANYANSLKVIDGVDNRLERAKKYFTPDMLKQALNIANTGKLADLWHAQQKQKRAQEEAERRQELIKKCDANYFYRLIRNGTNGHVIKNEGNLYYLQALCFFFSNDIRFKDELGLDPDKGLWVRGLPGRGKTFPLQLIQANELQPFKIHSIIHIAKEVAENGSYEINDAVKVIDDVGSEQAIVNHYGTKINWFKDFIELYYAARRPFNRLIVTTNLDFDQIENLYGFRVRSRIKDMFNIIDVMGNDMRGL